jgi:hypothetical protein
MHEVGSEGKKNYKKKIGEKSLSFDRLKCKD